MPINVDRSIRGRIKDITSSHPKSTDFMFRGCRLLFIAYTGWAISFHTYCIFFVLQIYSVFVFVIIHT